MKHVNDFVKFDVNAWVQGKDFEVRAIYDRTDKETGAYLGKSVQIVITKDDCKNYVLRENEENFSLAYEKIYVNCDVCSAKIGSKVKLDGMTVKLSAKPTANGAYLVPYFNIHELK